MPVSFLVCHVRALVITPRHTQPSRQTRSLSTRPCTRLSLTLPQLLRSEVSLLSQGNWIYLRKVEGGTIVYLLPDSLIFLNNSIASCQQGRLCAFYPIYPLALHLSLLDCVCVSAQVNFTTCVCLPING